MIRHRIPALAPRSPPGRGRGPGRERAPRRGRPRDGALEARRPAPRPPSPPACPRRACTPTSRPGACIPDVLTYVPQYPLWSDGAQKRRWMRLPPGTSIDASDPDGVGVPGGDAILEGVHPRSARRDADDRAHGDGVDVRELRVGRRRRGRDARARGGRARSRRGPGRRPPRHPEPRGLPRVPRGTRGAHPRRDAAPALARSRPAGAARRGRAARGRGPRPASSDAGSCAACPRRCASALPASPRARPASGPPSATSPRTAPRATSRRAPSPRSISPSTRASRARGAASPVLPTARRAPEPVPPARDRRARQRPPRAGAPRAQRAAPAHVLAPCRRPDASARDPRARLRRHLPARGLDPRGPRCRRRLARGPLRDAADRSVHPFPRRTRGSASPLAKE